MVLEEASSQYEPSSSFTEAPPTSDIDPYASSNNPNSPYSSSSESVQIYTDSNKLETLTVDLAALPHSFRIFGPRQHPDALAYGIQQTVYRAAGTLGRPVRQQEADAFAFHLAKSFYVGSLGPPVGYFLAGGVAWRGRKTYRFPGWQPFEEGSRFSVDRFGPLRGQLARVAWQVLRGTAYTFVGGVIGSIFFGGWALTLNSAGRALDPRLKEWVEAFNKRMKDGRGIETPRRTAQGEESEGARQGGHETFEMARQRRAVQMQQRQRQQQQGGLRGQAASTRDDMSPTGGAFEEDFMSTGSDTGLMTDGQSREEQYRAENAISTYDSGRRKESSTQQMRSSSSSSSSSSQQGTARSSSSSGGGSGAGAWDRLRQNAMSGSSSSPSGSSARVPGSSRSSTSDSSGGDSFSFSQPEEDRQLAKSEAQRDFDKRIEREREGHDFSESGSGSRRR